MKAMKFYIGTIEIEFSVRRVRYYEIIGYHVKKVIGYCTSDGLEDVKHEEPRAELREISRKQWLSRNTD